MLETLEDDRLQVVAANQVQVRKRIFARISRGFSGLFNPFILSGFCNLFIVPVDLQRNSIMEAPSGQTRRRQEEKVYLSRCLTLRLQKRKVLLLMSAKSSELARLAVIGEYISGANNWQKLAKTPTKYSVSFLVLCRVALLCADGK